MNYFDMVWGFYVNLVYTDMIDTLTRIIQDMTESTIRPLKFKVQGVLDHEL